MLEKIAVKESTIITETGRVRVTYNNRVIEDGIERASYYTVETIDPDKGLSDQVKKVLADIDLEVEAKKIPVKPITEEKLK